MNEPIDDERGGRDVLPSATSEEKVDRLYDLVVRMSGDVLHVRKATDPIGVRRRIVIIAVSAFFGGVLSNTVLWLAGVTPLIHR